MPPRGGRGQRQRQFLSSLCAHLEALVRGGSPEQMDEQIACIEAEYQWVAAAPVGTAP